MGGEGGGVVRHEWRLQKAGAQTWIQSTFHRLWPCIGGKSGNFACTRAYLHTAIAHTHVYCTHTPHTQESTEAEVLETKRIRAGESFGTILRELECYRELTKVLHGDKRRKSFKLTLWDCISE